MKCDGVGHEKDGDEDAERVDLDGARQGDPRSREPSASAAPGRSGAGVQKEQQGSELTELELSEKREVAEDEREQQRGFEAIEAAPDQAQRKEQARDQEDLVGQRPQLLSGRDRDDRERG